jgi:glycosyltransferase involved in cell wall biosynthesis
VPDPVGRISVVIPTRGRARLLRRALSSVEAQTVPPLETIVVVDGQDPETVEMLESLSLPNLRWQVNADSVGGSQARNQGVRAAVGEWIALLDDDDEWLPSKLEHQALTLAVTSATLPMGTSQLITRTPAGDYVGPPVPPRDGQPLSEYLFTRGGAFAGGGRIQTSTLLVPRRLLLDVPFDVELPRYQDTDWVLRAAAAGATIVMTMEPLSIWYLEEERGTIGASFRTDWRFAVNWIQQRRHLVTRRAYASYMLIRVAGIAAAAGEWEGARTAWREAWRNGRPRLLDVLLFGAKWAIPPNLRRWVRVRLTARRPDATR